MDEWLEIGYNTEKGGDKMNYLNHDAPIINFKMLVDSKVYVDKSMMIEIIGEKIATADRYICVTRPRRFGKTFNVNMLGAYFTKGKDSHPLFEHLNIAKTKDYRKHLNQYNVIYIDFSRQPQVCKDYDTYITSIYKGIQKDIAQAYHLQVDEYDSLGKLLEATKDSFIFLLDEWDSAFYKKFMRQEDKEIYLAFLKDVLKDRAYVKLAYMTGVLPIAKYSSGSELNVFQEYNFMNDHVYENYFGFNEEEVRKLCAQYQSVSYEELKYWYDGYYLSDGRSLFNPRSVNNAITNQVCLNYWTETGPMNEIAEYVEHNVDEVREDIVKLVSGIPVEVELQGYSAVELQLDTRDEILSAMVVFGFLSYHDGCLRIPNHELMLMFQSYY